MRHNGPTKTAMDTETTPPATEGDACNTTVGTSYQDRFGCEDADGDGTPMVMQRGPQFKVQMHSRMNQVNGPIKMVMAMETTPVESMLTIVQPHSELQQNWVTSDVVIWTVMGTLTRTTPSQRIRHNGVMQTETVTGTRVR